MLLHFLLVASLPTKRFMLCGEYTEEQVAVHFRPVLVVLDNTTTPVT
jgi:hypothetical protein